MEQAAIGQRDQQVAIAGQADGAAGDQIQQRRHQADALAIDHDAELQIEPVDAGRLRQIELDVAGGGDEVEREILGQRDGPALGAEHRHVLEHEIDPGGGIHIGHHQIAVAVGRIGGEDIGLDGGQAAGAEAAAGELFGPRIALDAVQGAAMLHHGVRRMVRGGGQFDRAVAPGQTGQRGGAGIGRGGAVLAQRGPGGIEWKLGGE